MLKAPESWVNLEQDCMLAHGCAMFQLKSAISRRDRKLQRKIERERSEVQSVVEAVKQSLTTNPDQTPEELTKSVIAILTPWVLRIISSWLISAFQKSILDWLVNRLKPAP